MNKIQLGLQGYVFFLLALLVFPSPAQAEERVLSFDVTAVLQEDASMIVTERIRVNIEQKIIRHGIAHAFPIKEPYDDYKLRHYGFELLSVKLDGKRVNFYENSLGYHFGIAVGREGVGAPLGEHTYEIVYKTTGHVRWLANRDEIYYNVMGNNWALPVDQVSFTLQLPGADTAAFIETGAYTGFCGEAGNDYVLRGKDTIITTRTLYPGEGLTVAMAWEKGLVAQPEESFANFIGANRTPVLLGIFIIILLYFIVARLAFTRSSKDVVVPLFSPPDGMSPGYMASLKAMAYQGRMLHADIVWAAVNGFLRVDARDKKKILLQKQKPAPEPERMKAGGEWAGKQCRELSNDIFWKKDEVDLRSKDGQAAAAGAFGFLERKYAVQQKDLWKHSYVPAILGGILFLSLFIWALQYIYSPMLDIDVDYGGAGGYLLIICALYGLIGFSIYAMRKAFAIYDGLRRLALLLLLPLLIAGVLGTLWALSSDDYFFMLILAASFGVTAWFAFKTPRRLTPKGRKKYAVVQGLEMYIRTAETDRLAKLNAPADTVEKFEELLPYAVALDCAEAWQKRFDKVLLETDYMPGWVEVGGLHSYSTALRMAARSSGMAAAAKACARLSRAASQSRGFASSAGSSGFGSGSKRGSAGGGSGGSSVGGW